jgi:ribosomal protein S18 acetylase RimI-like enzyme
MLRRPVASVPGAAGNGAAPIAGFVIARVTVDDAELLSLGVTRRFRRHGLGRRLVSETLVRVMALGADSETHSRYRSPPPQPLAGRPAPPGAIR